MSHAWTDGLSTTGRQRAQVCTCEDAASPVCVFALFWLFLGINFQSQVARSKDVSVSAPASQK